MTRASIIFDLDGTLIDSAPDIQAIANGLLEAEGAAPLSLTETRSFIGSGVPAFVSRARKARDVPSDRQAPMVAAFIEVYHTAFSRTELYPGARDMLAQLHRRHALGICTNKVAGPTHAVLEHFGIDHYFGSIFGGDSLPSRKPDPATLHAAFCALDGTRRIYVGDSEVDAETAERAGVPFLLFSGGYRKSPVARIPNQGVFDAHADLESLVEKTLVS